MRHIVSFIATRASGGRADGCRPAARHRDTGIRTMVDSAPAKGTHFAISFMLLGIGTMGLGLALFPLAARAQSYGRGPLEKGEYVATFVEDIRFPKFSNGTYFTFLYTSYENGAPFYSGIVMKGAWQKNVLNNAFWRGHMKGQVQCLYTGPTIFSSSTGGEGATGGASGPIPLMKPNEWYTIVYKIWKPEHNPRKISYFGLWIKDLKANRWHHMATFQLPVLSRGLSSLGGFIEQITTRNQVHEFHRRHSYGLVDGKGWRSLNTVTVRTHKPTSSHVALWRIQDHPADHVQVVTHAQQEDLLPDHNVPTDGKPHTYRFTQPQQPRFDPFQISQMRVRRCGNQLLIHWEMADGSPPHVEARVEIADASNAGEILETHNAPTSFQHSILLDTQVRNPLVTLVLRSIFDQRARSRPTRLIEMVAPPVASPVTGDTVAGLHYTYYEHQSDVRSLAEALTLAIEPQEPPLIKVTVHGARRAYVALAVHGSPFGIFATTTHGLCPPTHQRDFSGGKYMGHPLTTKDEPANPSWICLARRGRTFFTYYSHDGKHWHKANELYDRSRSTTKVCRVGFRFETSLAIGSPYLTARLDGTEFQSKFDPALEPKSLPLKIEWTDRAIMGLIHVEGDTILARTMHGLWISRDFGKTWTPHPGQSEEKADGVIRSLAVAPNNANEWYCAEVENGESKLLYSADGGASWQRLACPVTFSSQPEDVMLGEIVALDKHTNRMVIAGNGLYVSEDRGKSWSLLGHDGKRISFVCFNPDARPRDRRRQLYTAVTSPGGPSLISGGDKTQGESSVYVWDLDQKRCVAMGVPAPVLDMRFQLRDKYRWFYIATTRGIYETVNGGSRFLQMYAPEAYAVSKAQETLYDQPVTAFDMEYQSVRQHMMYACKMWNVDANTGRMFYMKRPFDAHFPPMAKDEYVLKALAHPTDPEKAVIGTTHGAYYCEKNGMRGRFWRAQINP